MTEKSTFWKKTGLQDWFLPSGKVKAKESVKSLTPDEVYKYILEKFRESIRQLSFANRIVFYHEYLICFNEEDYQEFLAHKQGLLGIIVHESVNQFYKILDEYRKSGKTVEPSSSKWVFRLVSHPDYERGDKGFIGKLLPGSAEKQDNLRVTFIPRQTGIAQSLAVNQDILDGFTYYTEGYYEMPYQEPGSLSGGAPVSSSVPAGPKTLARLETILPDQTYRGKKVAYLMNDSEILVCGNDDPAERAAVFSIPSEWVNSPHLKIRHSAADGKMYLASFGEKTILNEKEVPVSLPEDPLWVELPFNSRILLNGIIGVNIFKP